MYLTSSNKLFQLNKTQFSLRILFQTFLKIASQVEVISRIRSMLFYPSKCISQKRKIVENFFLSRITLKIFPHFNLSREFNLSLWRNIFCCRERSQIWNWKYDSKKREEFSSPCRRKLYNLEGRIRYIKSTPLYSSLFRQIHTCPSFPFIFIQ